MRILQTWTLGCANWDIPVQKSTRFCWDHLAAGDSENTMVISRQEESKIGLVYSLAWAILSIAHEPWLPFASVGERGAHA